jgi:phosphohistidine phosphatase
MNELYVVRHGIAVPHGTPGVPEDDRPLTGKGEGRMKEIGRGLAEIGLEVDRIVSSPLPRVLRTAEIIAIELDSSDRLETSQALTAGSDATEIRDWLGERTEERLMIVGHNPAFSELVGLLVLGELGRLPLELKKGGIAALSATELHSPRFRIDWIAPPRLLRRLGDGD